MTKIKNFRIHLRPREVGRWLKNNFQVAVTPEIELMIELTIKKVADGIHPAAIYTTLTRATAEKATSLVFPDRSVAASIVAVTTGDFIQEKLNQESQPHSIESRILTAVQEEALSQSIQFAIRLLHEQAKEEECDLSAPVLAEDISLLSSLTTLLGSQRIGVEIDSAKPTWMVHARLIWTYWTPIRRAASKKAEATARAAKAA